MADPFQQAALRALRLENRRSFPRPPGEPPRPGKRAAPLTEQSAPSAFDKKIRTIQEGGHRTWEVFANFCEMAAITLSQVPIQDPAREKRYLEIVGRYKPEHVQLLAEMLGTVVAGLGDTPSVDFLGSAFMRLELGDKWHGQFFTPMALAQAMAKVMLGSKEHLDAEIAERGFIRVMDPASGAGALLIAMAGEMLALDHNPQTQMFCEATDIASVPFWMCYVQLSLYGIPARVIHGNSLTRETWATWTTPAYKLGFWDGKLRRGYALGSALDVEARKQNQGDAAQLEREADEEEDPFAGLPEGKVHGQTDYVPYEDDLAYEYAKALYDTDPESYLDSKLIEELHEEAAKTQWPEEIEYPRFYELPTSTQDQLTADARRELAGTSGRLDAYDEITSLYGASPAEMWGWKEPTVYLTKDGFENITWRDPATEPDYGGMELARDLTTVKAADAPGQTYLFARDPDSDDLVDEVAKHWRMDHWSGSDTPLPDWARVTDDERAYWTRVAKDYVARNGKLATLAVLDVAAGALSGEDLRDLGFKEPSLYITKAGTLDATLKAPEGLTDYAGPAPDGVSWETITDTIDEVLEGGNADGPAILEAIDKLVSGLGLAFAPQMTQVLKRLADAATGEGGGPFGQPPKKPPEPGGTPGVPGVPPVPVVSSSLTPPAFPSRRVEQVERPSSAIADWERMVAAQTGIPARRPAPTRPWEREREAKPESAIAAWERMVAERKKLMGPIEDPVREQLERAERLRVSELEARQQRRLEALGRTPEEIARTKREVEALRKRPAAAVQEQIEREAAAIKAERAFAALPPAERATRLREQREQQAALERARAAAAQERAREAELAHRASGEQQRIEASERELAAVFAPGDFTAARDRDLEGWIAGQDQDLAAGALAYSTALLERNIAAHRQGVPIPVLATYDPVKFRLSIAALGAERRGDAFTLAAMRKLGAEPAVVEPLPVASPVSAPVSAAQGSAQKRAQLLERARATKAAAADPERIRLARERQAELLRAQAARTPSVAPTPEEPTAYELLEQAAEEEIEAKRAQRGAGVSRRGAAQIAAAERRRRAPAADFPAVSPLTEKQLRTMAKLRKGRARRENQGRLCRPLEHPDSIQATWDWLESLPLWLRRFVTAIWVGDRVPDARTEIAAFDLDENATHEALRRWFDDAVFAGVYLALGRAANVPRLDIIIPGAQEVREYARNNGDSWTADAVEGVILSLHDEHYVASNRVSGRDYIAQARMANRVCALGSNGERLLRLAYLRMAGVGGIQVIPPIDAIHVLHLAERIRDVRADDNAAVELAVIADVLAERGIPVESFNDFSELREHLFGPRATNKARA